MAQKLKARGKKEVEVVEVVPPEKRNFEAELEAIDRAIVAVNFDQVLLPLHTTPMNQSCLYSLAPTFR